MRTLLLGTFTFLFMTTHAQIVINELIPPNTVELKNVGGAGVDVSLYNLCTFPEYEELENETIICGTLFMEPGTLLKVNTSWNFSATDGEMGLYLNDSGFGNPATLIDYVEWGSTGHFRSGTAVSAGQWTTGAFVPDFSDCGALEYDGTGNAVTDWVTQDMPIAGCAENPLDGCAAACMADGGTIVTSDNTNVCAGDGMADLINVTLTGSSGMNSEWVITDEAGFILNLPAGPPFDFEGAGPGNCFIWNISYDDGLTGLAIGQNTAGIAGCFDFSNAISVIREGVNGGLISTLDDTLVCAGDGMPDPISVALVEAEGDNQQWVITDQSGNILDLPAVPPFDFEGAGAGVCLIWNLSFADGLAGLLVGNNVSDLTGCHAFSNSISVTRTGVNGGAISTLDDTVVCAGDGVVDPINVLLDGQLGDNQQWVITDEGGVILSLPAGPPFDFENAGPGTCLIWNLGYADGLTGLTEGGNVADLTGCLDFSNSITVIRLSAEGGIISTSDDTTVCAGDGIPDLINVTLSGTSGANQQWVITDQGGTILALPDVSPFDFDGAGPGICLIWNLSYADGLTGLSEGDNVEGLVGCYSFSNAITVVRNSADGGMIATSDPTMTCAGDGVPDLIDVTLTGNGGDNSAWVITDVAGTVLGLPAAPPFDFEGAGAGSCLIWHLSYADGLTGLALDSNVAALAGCFDFSNSITVVRQDSANCVECNIDAGVISTIDNTTICAGDGSPDPIDVSLAVTDMLGSNTGWVITDTAGSILGLPPGPPFDLEGAGAGVCLVWHITYEDGLTGLTLGQNTSNLMGCFDLSNSVAITRLQPEAGTISTTDSTTICAGDGIPDPINVSLTAASGDSTVWLITDTNNIILAIAGGPPFNLSGAGPGVCLIWHLAFMDGLTGLQDGNHLSLLNGCYDLSNPIHVTRVQPAGGTISTNDSTTICAGDGVPDPINVTLQGAAGGNSQWIITDTLNNILALPPGPPFDLNDAGPGVCLIWHLSFADGLMNANIDNNVDDFIGCYSLSNALAITRLVDDDCISTQTRDPELERQITVYPNPVSSALFVESEEADMEQIVLYNSVGQVVMARTLPSVEQVQMDISSLLSGFYLVRVKTDRGAAGKRILVR